jgi:hypothetical protein
MLKFGLLEIQNGHLRYAGKRFQQEMKPAADLYFDNENFPELPLSKKIIDFGKSITVLGTSQTVRLTNNTHGDILFQWISGDSE